jgi:hypothetical protein
VSPRPSAFNSYLDHYQSITSTSAFTTFLKEFRACGRRFTAHRWQDFDVRGRVNWRACATVWDDQAATSITTFTGPGRATNPARADSTPTGSHQQSEHIA